MPEILSPERSPKPDIEATSSHTPPSVLGTLGTVAGIAGATLGATSAEAAMTPTFGRSTPQRRLLRRVSYGLTNEDQLRAKRTSYSRLLDYYLNYQNVDNGACEGAVAGRYPRVHMTLDELSRLPEDWITAQQLGEALIYRAVHSKHQLLERMIEFWTDHFNIHVDKVGGALMMDVHERVIRPNALGKFRDLLKGVSKSPAMLLYLDNTENHGDFGNVNFARELMELHTISVSGGYTPADIRNVARCFSGWSIEWDSQQSNYLHFVFNEWAHSTLPKTVLGVSIPPGMQSEGDFVLDMLAGLPQTAQFIARKLCKFFVSYEPSTALVNAAAQKFMDTDGDIKAVLKVILQSRNIEKAPWKFKRPYYLMINALRCMYAMVDTEMWTLRYEYMARAGNLPHSWMPPDGFPDRLEFWVDLMLPRWNFGFALARGWVWGCFVNPGALVANSTSPRVVADRVNTLLCAKDMANSDRQAILDYLAAQPVDWERRQAAFALGLSSPSFQWY